MEVRWLSREQCGLPPAPTNDEIHRPVSLVGSTVHHTATADNDPNPVATWARIYHEAVDGGLAERYIDTPYNAGVAKLAPGVGGILLGRPNFVVGAHARSRPDWGVTDGAAGIANLFTLGVALIGTDPTPEALAALDAYLFCAAASGAPLIWCHSDWGAWIGLPTACPGDPLRAHVVQLRAAARFG